MTAEEEITKGFMEGFDCSMQVLAKLAPEIGLTEEQGKRLGSCFGVGMMQGSVCGAVSAAMIAIGYKYGNTKPKDMAQKGLCMAKRQEFIDRFTEEFGSVTCPGLLKLDLRLEEDAKKANEIGVITNICPKFCVKAIEIAKDVL